MTKLVQSFAKDFLRHRSIEDVRQSVLGELPELATNKATYFYGNGEVIASPADESIPDIHFDVCQIGSKFYLVEA